MSTPNNPRLSAVIKFNERLKTALADHNNNYAYALRSEHDRIMNGLDAIVHIRAKPNLAETPAAHTLRLAKAANKLKEEALKAKERALNNYQEYSMMINNNLMVVSGMSNPSPYAAEIRAALKAMSMSERLEYMKQVSEKGDGSTFAAIFDAPEILTGIPKDIAIDYSKVLYEKAAPGIVQQGAELQEAMNIIDRTLEEVNGLTGDYSNPETVREIEAEIQKSMEAQTRFDSAMG